MGGSVSAGVDNDDLVDNLVSAEFIKTSSVERAFRAVDRGMYFTPQGRESAYTDLPWKSGNIHLSAPCIYCDVMESLNLRPGMSFLNLGSGTGYLSTMAGLILGPYGINHGVEIHHDVVQYAQEKLEEFKKTAAAIDEYGFCEPKFIQGNCLQLDACSFKYDRVYCGAACPPSYENYIKSFVKVGGVLVYILKDSLLKVSRLSETTWEKKSVQPVAFASLIEPQSSSTVLLPIAEPISLMDACRTTIRAILQAAVDHEHPELKIPLAPKVKSKKQRTLQRLFMPMFESENLRLLNSLAYLDRVNRRDIETLSDWDDNTSTSSRAEGSNSSATSTDRPPADDASGSSCSTGTEYRPRGFMIQLEESSSDDSDDPSDSSSSGSLTRLHKGQRTLVHAMDSHLVAQDQVAGSVVSSLPHQDDSSDTSMDIDRSMSMVNKRLEGYIFSKKGRNKRKEAEMEESDYPNHGSPSMHVPPSVSGSPSGSNHSHIGDDGKLTCSDKKLSGAKKEKVDSGVGDISWDISSPDVGSELDLASDSDSEEDRNLVHKIDEVDERFRHGRRRRNGKTSVKKDRKSSLPQEQRKQMTNAYVLFMRSKIQQLPLPPSIKSYINYHRDL